MSLIKSTAYLTAIVALGLAACGDDDSNNEPFDGARPGGTGGQGGNLGGTGGVPRDGAALPDTRIDSQADLKQDSLGYDVPILDAPSEYTTCSGSNPAMANCRKSVNDCTPSACFCSSDGDWVCTADCRLDLPICPDGGVMNGDVGAGPDGGVACVNDDACKLVSDYCDGCNCLALGPGESAPICKGTLVQCLLDPCALKLPKCLHGQCIAAARTQSS